jgi:hypothetical protein
MAEVATSQSSRAASSSHARTPVLTPVPQKGADSFEAEVLRLQSTMGNRATMLFLQAKLAIGPVDDPYEREADRAAEAVTGGLSEPIGLHIGTAGPATMQRQPKDPSKPPEMEEAEKARTGSAESAEALAKQQEEFLQLFLQTFRNAAAVPPAPAVAPNPNPRTAPGQLRQPTPPSPTPDPNSTPQAKALTAKSYTDGAKKMVPALAKTEQGKALTAWAESLGKQALKGIFADVVTAEVTAETLYAMLAGLLGVMSHRGEELPIEDIDIPLDWITPGLEVNLKFKGKLNLRATAETPVEAGLTFKYTFGKAADQEKKSDTSQVQKDIKRLQTADEKLKQKMRFKPGTPEAEQEQAEQAARQRELYGGIKSLDQQTREMAESYQKKYPNASKLGDSSGPAGALQLTKPAVSRPEDELRRKPANHATAPAPEESVQQTLASPGKPLDASTREFMETRFGEDFSQVQVHSDAQAQSSAAAVNAHAYTVGRDVVFAAGQYAPETVAGRKLLAHELTHVVQQSAGTHASSGPVTRGGRDDRCEREAEASSEGLPGQPAALSRTVRAPGPTLQRFESFEHVELGDQSPGALSEILGLLGSAEVALRRSQTAWQELTSARALWEKQGGDTAALELLEQATHDNDEGNYQEALAPLQKAVPRIMAWLNSHPEAGSRTARVIAGKEHPEAEKLGAQGAAPTLTLRRSGLQVTYGEVIALGDFYPSPETMHNAPREELTNSENKGILDLLRAQVARRKGINFDQAYQEATEGREVKRYDELGQFLGLAGAEVGGESYGTLARNNPEHFAIENRVAWEGYHTRAISTAAEARAIQDPAARAAKANEALSMNAFGDHFLTDAFSAGHLLYKANLMRMAEMFWREAGEESLEALTLALLNDHWTAVARLVSRGIPVVGSIPVIGILLGAAITAVAPSFVRDQIKQKIRGIQKEKPDLISNAAVKVAHDHYSTSGVEVHNAKGDVWRTLGDDHLNKSAATRQLASLAVLRSRADVSESLKAPLGSDPLDAWGYAPLPPPGFDESAFAEARALMLRRKNNPLADLFIKNLPAIEHAEAQEEEAGKRDKEAEKRRNRSDAYLNFIRSTHRIEDHNDSDDVARDIVANSRVYSTLTLEDKSTLVLEMLEGFTGDEDERAILYILDETQRHGQLRTLVSRVPIARLKSDINGSERNELNQILARDGLPTE